jgi:hypothetical protein
MKAPNITRRDLLAAIVGAVVAGAILATIGATPARPSPEATAAAPGPYTVAPVATSDKEGMRGIILDTRDGRAWVVVGATIRPALYDESAPQVLPRLYGLDGRRAPIDITTPAEP